MHLLFYSASQARTSIIMQYMQFKVHEFCPQRKDIPSSNVVMR